MQDKECLAKKLPSRKGPKTTKDGECGEETKTRG